MSLPPLPRCSNRGVGSTAFEPGFARKEQWGSELTRVPMGETASVNVIARICKPSGLSLTFGDSGIAEL
ncbi:MAG TPA: hypothetical protein VIY29_03595 [Ktedonobacteraceae bacterium]